MTSLKKGFVIGRSPTFLSYRSHCIWLEKIFVTNAFRLTFSNSASPLNSSISPDDNRKAIVSVFAFLGSEDVFPTTVSIIHLRFRSLIPFKTLLLLWFFFIAFKDIYV